MGQGASSSITQNSSAAVIKAGGSVSKTLGEAAAAMFSPLLQAGESVDVGTISLPSTISTSSSLPPTMQQPPPPDGIQLLSQGLKPSPSSDTLLQQQQQEQHAEDLVGEGGGASPRNSSDDNNNNADEGGGVDVDDDDDDDASGALESIGALPNLASKLARQRIRAAITSGDSVGRTFSARAPVRPSLSSLFAPPTPQAPVSPPRTAISSMEDTAPDSPMKLVTGVSSLNTSTGSEEGNRTSTASTAAPASGTMGGGGGINASSSLTPPTMTTTTLEGGGGSGLPSPIFEIPPSQVASTAPSTLLTLDSVASGAPPGSAVVPPLPSSTDALLSTTSTPTAITTPHTGGDGRSYPTPTGSSGNAGAPADTAKNRLVGGADSKARPPSASGRTSSSSSSSSSSSRLAAIQSALPKTRFELSSPPDQSLVARTSSSTVASATRKHAAPSDIFGAPAFAAGRAFSSTTLDALMCEMHFAPHVLFFIKLVGISFFYRCRSMHHIIWTLASLPPPLSPQSHHTHTHTPSPARPSLPKAAYSTPPHSRCHFNGHASEPRIRPGCHGHGSFQPQ